MKPRLALFLLTALTATPALLRGQNLTPLIPSGSLSAFPTIVQAGTHPTLTWDVTLPESVTDIVTITPPGTITPKRCLIMDVRILGASVKRVWLNSQGKVTKWEWVPTEAQMNYNNTGYTRIFYNTHDKVNPNSIVKTIAVGAGKTINFGGRYVTSSGSWSTWYSTTNCQYNVVALKDGDTPPTTTPLYQQPTIESFILPYLNEDGNIKLGARDVIYLMELTHTDRNHGGFDLQDLAILVTFYDEVSHNGVTSDCAGTTEGDGTMSGGTTSGGTTSGGTTSGGTTSGGTTSGGTTGDGSTSGGTTSEGNGNNGHGNNTDGVDSSNPGNAPFTDSDPNVDDEENRGRRKK